MMNNEHNSKKCKEPCKGTQEKEKAFKQALTEGMAQYDMALRHLANR